MPSGRRPGGCSEAPGGGPTSPTRAVRHHLRPLMASILDTSLHFPHQDASGVFKYLQSTPQHPKTQGGRSPQMGLLCTLPSPASGATAPPLPPSRLRRERLWRSRFRANLESGAAGRQGAAGAGSSRPSASFPPPGPARRLEGRRDPSSR